MDFTTIAKLRKYLTVKESKPGQIQIKFSTSIMGDSEALKLAQSPPKMPEAVKSTDLSIFTRTLTINYDDEVIPQNLLSELISTDDNGRASAIVEELHTKLYA